jgi:intracellular multiplication protein IcmO
MAQNKDNFRGILPNQEINPSVTWRDHRNVKQRFSDYMADPSGFAMIIGMMGAMFFIFPQFSEIFALITIWLIRYASKKEFRLPFRIPKTSGLLDPGEPSPIDDKPSPAAGISFFGNERKTRKELWFNNSDLRTHVLIFGSTGAGKTETLLSLAYNALVQGSGLIYVDGKGENVLYTKVFAMARTMGREDDVLVINYMTGSRDVFGPQEKKLSNTLNPFSSGGSGGLTELLVSLMDDSGGGGDMWKGRAISLISAIMMALVYMRDQKEILLDVDAIREHLILDNIIKLFKTRRDFPSHIRAALRAYLVSLPGFQEAAPKQNDTVMEQHGYLQMQFSRLLGSLAESYGFIFKTNLGEVDFKDVVLNRRILVVLLPALEKSTDELANLGKIIVACLKQMMASALGSTIEGSYAEVVETKPTTSEMPFMTVLDEYGYYAVKGSAVMPAQARSLGFSMIFAGQDLPAFEKASKEEAASIVANCNVKIFMKLEDPDSTFALFEKSVGEALVSSVGVMEMQTGGLVTTFQAGKSASVETKKRGNLLDLKDQREGEAHIIFKSAVIRAKMFYASPPKPPYIRMNYFVRVEPPDTSVITNLDNGLKQLVRNLTNVNKIKEMEENLESDNKNVEKLRDLMTRHESSLSMDEAAFASIAALGNEVFQSYDETIGEFRQSLDSQVQEEEEEEVINVFSSPKDRADFIREQYKVVRESQNIKDDRDEEEDDDNDLMEEDEEVNVFINEAEAKKDYARIERMVGASEEEAQEASGRAIEDMKKLSRYPIEENIPPAKKEGEIMDILHELDEMFDMDEDEDES